MKKAICSLAAFLAVSAPLYAGKAVEKTTIVPANDDSPSAFYGAVEGGLNLMQNGIGSFGRETSEKVGGAAGVKAGYEFGDARDLVTPALEAEALYTAFGHHWDGQVGGDGVTEKARVGTLAAMVNGIVNFNLGLLQPYFGAGAGFYAAKARFATKVSDGGQFDDGSERRDGFAWQLLGGVDYYFTPSVSAFTEYKWIEAVVRNGGEFLGNPTLGQHLLTAGVRYHF